MRVTLRPIDRVDRRACTYAALALACGASPTAAQSFSGWANPVDGSWTDGAKWTSAPNYPANAGGGTVTAVINASGAPYTVRNGASITIGRLEMGLPDATLLLNPGGTVHCTHACALNNGARVHVALERARPSYPQSRTRRGFVSSGVIMVKRFETRTPSGQRGFRARGGGFGWVRSLPQRATPVEARGEVVARAVLGLPPGRWVRRPMVLHDARRGHGWRTNRGTRAGSLNPPMH